MKNYYSSNPTFYLGIDCIIFGFNEGEISLLLLKRNFEPAMGEWSLMGGFVQKDESVDDAAKRVLAELTGLENVYMEQVGAFGAIDRDPGERVVSIAYYALININEYDRELVQKHNAYWVNITGKTHYTFSFIFYTFILHEYRLFILLIRYLSFIYNII